MKPIRMHTFIVLLLMAAVPRAEAANDIGDVIRCNKALFPSNREPHTRLAGDTLGEAAVSYGSGVYKGKRHPGFYVFVNDGSTDKATFFPYMSPEKHYAVNLPHGKTTYIGGGMTDENGFELPPVGVANYDNIMQTQTTEPSEDTYLPGVDALGTKGAEAALDLLKQRLLNRIQGISYHRPNMRKKIDKANQKALLAEAVEARRLHDELDSCKKVSGLGEATLAAKSRLMKGFDTGSHTYGKYSGEFHESAPASGSAEGRP